MRTFRVSKISVNVSVIVDPKSLRATRSRRTDVAELSLLQQESLRRVARSRIITDDRPRFVDSETISVGPLGIVKRAHLPAGKAEPMPHPAAVDVRAHHGPGVIDAVNRRGLRSLNLDGFELEG